MSLLLLSHLNLSPAGGRLCFHRQPLHSTTISKVNQSVCLEFIHTKRAHLSLKATEKEIFSNYFPCGRPLFGLCFAQSPLCHIQFTDLSRHNRFRKDFQAEVSEIMKQLGYLCRLDFLFVFFKKIFVIFSSFFLSCIFWNRMLSCFLHLYYFIKQTSILQQNATVEIWLVYCILQFSQF